MRTRQPRPIRRPRGGRNDRRNHRSAIGGTAMTHLLATLCASSWPLSSLLPSWLPARRPPGADGVILLADVTLKATALLAAAGLLALAMRRASAAGRHLVWLLAV